MSRRLVLKLAGSLALLVALGFLFLTSVRQTQAEPFVIPAADLDGWTIAIEPGGAPHDPGLSLRPRPELPMALMQQIFRRTMESLSAPAHPGIALLLQRELDRVSNILSSDELVLMARGAGLGSAPPEPVCLAVRRGADASEPRQIFFLLFDLPQLEVFRSEVAAALVDATSAADGAATAIDVDALAPILMFAASDRDAGRWLLGLDDPADACVAPAEVR